MGAGQGHETMKPGTIWVLGFLGINQVFRCITIFRISFNCSRGIMLLEAQRQTPTHGTSGNKQVSGIIHPPSKIPSRSRRTPLLTPPLIFPLPPCVSGSGPFLGPWYQLCPSHPSPRTGARALRFPSALVLMCVGTQLCFAWGWLVCMSPTGRRALTPC